MRKGICMFVSPPRRGRREYVRAGWSSRVCDPLAICSSNGRAPEYFSAGRTCETREENGMEENVYITRSHRVLGQERKAHWYDVNHNHGMS